MPLRLLALLPALLPALLCTVTPAVELGDGKKPPKGKEQDEGEWLKSLEVPEGLQPAVWAHDQQILNAVAIDIDEQGRLFAAETFRWRRGGVIDVRGNMFLYKDDLVIESVADRAAMIEKYKDKFPKDFYTKESERIRLLVDTDNDGKADQVSVFAEDMRDPVDGPAAGIMAFNGRIYLANIPKIYAFEDNDNDGKADTREVLADGFGPRFSISGHDLHGLAMGPDGRIYFSIGDRGFNVTTKEGVTYKNPISGGVFRCDLDGSNLEQYYYQLRNPQELAFDAWGNLFTVDNNADIGDASRVVYLLEGGNSAWSHGWQLLGNDSFAKGSGLSGRQPNPWLDEGLWKSYFPEQPAWVLPAVGHITSGPSGLAFYPGVGFGDRLQDHFLICDYRASRDSGVWSFKLNEDGAGYTLPDEQKKHFLWGLPPTDVTFGYDGKVYVSDYIGGWELNNHGRVVTVSDPMMSTSAAVTELTALMKAGFTKRTTAELGTLLSHADMRVRLRAQFELAKRDDGEAELLKAATTGATLFARAHGIWGLGQRARRTSSVADHLLPLLTDSEARIREVTVKTLGDLRYAKAADGITALLTDSNARVVSFAAIAAGRLQLKAVVPALKKILSENDNKDPYLRHAAVMGLLGCADAAQLTAMHTDSSAGVRMGALLALRRLADGGCATFLNDADPLISAEAIRAVYDNHLLDAMPQLIAKLNQPLDKKIPAQIARLIYLRLINAAYRHGDNRATQVLADFAGNEAFPTEIRQVALDALEAWKKPSWVDPVYGYPRPAQSRDTDPAAEQLKAGIMAIIDRKEERLLASAVKLAQQYGFGLPDSVLITILDNNDMATDVRVEALRLVTERKIDGLATRIAAMLGENNPDIRRAAFQAQVALDPSTAVQIGIAALNIESTDEPDVKTHFYQTEGPWSALPIGEPTAANLAPKGTITWIDNFSPPHADAGASDKTLPRLNDGQLAKNDDDTKSCVWFEQNQARWILDLGSSIDLGRVDTYSWHKSNRAEQNYDLYAANGDAPPDPTVTDPQNGWVLLGKVSTKTKKEGGKFVSTIINANGSLGSWRWLMWDSNRKGTFYCEVAVYPHGQTPVGLVAVETDHVSDKWEALSMGAPQASDVGVAATAMSVAGFAKPKAGADGDKLTRLFSGELPTSDDDPEHNTFADDGEARWLVDLGKPVELARINTYSWHKADRAQQAFTLWAANGDTAPDPTAKKLTEVGWRELVRVKSKKDGGKHGSSILGIGAPLGTYRWLLWQHDEKKSGTFISRIDILPSGIELPPIKRPLSAAAIALKQEVLTSFGAMSDDVSARVLSEWLDQLIAGNVIGDVQLELVTAAEQRKEPEIAEKLKQYRASLNAADPLARFRISLHGGDVEKGENIFNFHISQCIKCHSVAGVGGNAGPDLKGLAKRLSPELMLESLVDPNKVVVPGFGLATISLKDGTTISGSILKEDKKGVLVKKADNKEELIDAKRIKVMSPPMSPMPPMGLLMKPDELRDVLAYLQSLR